MKYDLSAMIDARGKNKARRRRALRLRKHGLREEQQLISIYKSIVAFWRKQVKSLEPIRVVQDAIPDPEQITAVSDEVVIAAALSQLTEWIAQMSTSRRAVFMKRVKAVYGIDLSGLASNQIDSPMIQELTLWASELIQDVSSTVKKQVSTEIIASRAIRATQNEVAARVNEVLKKADRRAELIGADMSQKFSEKFIEAQSVEAGGDEYVWNHSFRPNPRRHHVERQGNKYKWSKPPYDGPPGHLPNCRCTAEPVF